MLLSAPLFLEQCERTRAGLCSPLRNPGSSPRHQERERQHCFLPRSV